MQKSHSHKRFALLAFSLLIGLCLCCFLGIRNAQRQDALDQRLIVVLSNNNNDSKQALPLIEAGADPNTRLHSATMLFSMLEFTDKLLNRSTSSAIDNTTAFMMACSSPGPNMSNYKSYEKYYNNLFHVKLIRSMLLHGANIDVRSDHGMTALHWAVGGGRSKEIIKLLLDYGADPNLPDADGDTPVKWSQRNHRIDILALLRQYRKRP